MGSSMALHMPSRLAFAAGSLSGTVHCLYRYYFYNEGASVTAVLKDAGLVDIGAVRGQVEDSKSQVVSQLTGQFTWR